MYTPIDSRYQMGREGQDHRIRFGCWFGCKSKTCDSWKEVEAKISMKCNMNVIVRVYWIAEFISDDNLDLIYKLWCQGGSGD